MIVCGARVSDKYPRHRRPLLVFNNDPSVGNMVLEQMSWSTLSTWTCSQTQAPLDECYCCIGPCSMYCFLKASQSRSIEFCPNTDIKTPRATVCKPVGRLVIQARASLHIQFRQLASLIWGLVWKRGAGSLTPRPLRYPPTQHWLVSWWLAVMSLFMQLQVYTGSPSPALARLPDPQPPFVKITAFGVMAPFSGNALGRTPRAAPYLARRRIVRMA